MADDDARPALWMDGVRRAFGHVHALDRLTFALRPGEIVGLVGPNGSGKTTAIRIALGLEHADVGTVEVFGERMPKGRAKVTPRVGYMPQHEALYPDLSVEENVRFFARLAGIPRGDTDAAVARAVGLVDLSGRAGDRLHTLSGGMRRRASLAAALVHRPKLALLDEPTVGVDPDLRADMWAHFHDLAAHGTAILMSTHYLGEAEHCDRVVFIRAGRTVADGTPDDLRALARGVEGVNDPPTLEDVFLAIARGTLEAHR